ncbi:hypothetical protein WAI453_012043 [Rhynchosporium graminicola]
MPPHKPTPHLHSSPEAPHLIPTFLPDTNHTIIIINNINIHPTLPSEPSRTGTDQVRYISSDAAMLPSANSFSEHKIGDSLQSGNDLTGYNNFNTDQISVRPI